MKRILSMVLIILVAGCSNTSAFIDYGDEDTQKIQDTDASIGYEALKNAPICCTSLSELNYTTISTPGAFDYIITDKNDAFNFTTGKSFVQGITLPAAEGTIKISVSAPMVSSVFVPTIVILDEQYKPLRLYGEESIHYESGSVLRIDRFFANIEIPPIFNNGRHAKHLVILTTEKAMKETTKLVPPEPTSTKIDREALMIKANMLEPFRHTATGVVRLTFDYTPYTASSMKKTIAKELNDSHKAQAIVTTNEMENIKPKATAIKEPVATSQVSNNSIQPESENMYILLIEKSVKEEDYKKALRFVEEAEKAGSTKARDAMFEAMKNTNK
ncbi:MalM family protein [Psychromonas sp. MME2]|uniref:MalM family protein n=1 Tax=unclassified Psychromonas TaxID=2614957 RepID=UPI00339C6FCB